MMSQKLNPCLGFSKFLDCSIFIGGCYRPNRPKILIGRFHSFSQLIHKLARSPPTWFVEILLSRQENRAKPHRLPHS